MRTEKDVEAYLLRSNRRFRAVGSQPGTFLVESGGGMPAVAVRVDPPLVVVRVHIGELTGDAEEAAFYRRLLELNARELVHASYGIDAGQVVLSSALELENLDYNEIQATLDEIDVALAQQLPELARMAKGTIGGNREAKREE
jgi:hypothetical protein